MNLIVAVDRNWGIGKDGRLLFRIREDMKRLKRLTVGKTIVFGRKTMETFPEGKPLPERVNIVMTRAGTVPVDGIRVCRSAGDLFREIHTTPPGDVFLLGGESVYRQFLRYCDLAYVTRVEGSFDADSFIPDLDAEESWQQVDPGEPMNDGLLDYRWVVYRNLHPEEIPL